MGKRGPAPKGQYPGKSKVFSTRIRPDLREKLDAEAAISGHSVSQIVEHRLRRTFIEDDKIESAFGDRHTYLLMQLIAIGLRRARNPEQPEKNWLNDPVAFDAAIRFANGLLAAIRPDEPVGGTAPSELDGALVTASAINAPLAMWRDIHRATPSLPLSEGSREDHFAGMVRSELGQIAERPYFLGLGTPLQKQTRSAEAERASAKQRKPRHKGKKRS